MYSINDGHKLLQESNLTYCNTYISSFTSNFNNSSLASEGIVNLTGATGIKLLVREAKISTLRNVSHTLYKIRCSADA